MAKRVALLLVAVVALTACNGATNIDQERFDRENREILRQLGGD